MVVTVVAVLALAGAAGAADGDPVWKTPAQLERYIERHGVWFVNDFARDRIEDAECVGTGPSKRTRNGRAFNRFRCRVTYVFDDRTSVFRRIWVFEDSRLPGGWGWGVIYY